MMPSVVVHSNPRLLNQVESSQWLKAGFERHGIGAQITSDKWKGADIHVVQGPWYAYNEWLGQKNVLFLNCCFYGDRRFDLSVGWLRPDGTRDFKNHGMTVHNGILPELKPEKENRRCAVVFGDFGTDPTEQIIDAKGHYQTVYYRPHPAQTEKQPGVISLRSDLAGVWGLADVAIGGSSTVLVDAEINGLHVECSDPLHVVHHDGTREQWLTDLSWANWNYKQLIAGDFWEHLC
ncbi:hypothetical protein N9937_01100 [bacterium]|nr:hypothetical protein [bacterium]